MNGTIISEEKLLELKELAKEIEYLEFCITTGKRDDITLFNHRKLTEKLTNLILEL
jgi:hypothetical protein